MVSNDLLAFAASRYGFDADTLRFISDSTNEMYAFRKDGRDYILRFSQRPAETMRHTRAELNWLSYLAERGVSVALPLAASAGEFVTLTEDCGKSYLISAYVALTGVQWDRNDPARWNASLFRLWGRTMGDLHSVTKDYVPANNVDVHETFAERHELSRKAKRYPTIAKIATDLAEEIMALPRDRAAYGLIHYDLHQWNFLIDGDRLNVFDFDDGMYGWFALDIGVALYHALWWGRTNDARHDFTDEIIANFLDGYLSANELSDFWLAKIPMFMRYRQVSIFGWSYDSDADDAQEKERIYNIENGILFTGCTIDPTLFTHKKRTQNERNG